jgi:hypothetical protein
VISFTRETSLRLQEPFLAAERHVEERFAARLRGELGGPFDRLELDVLAVWSLVAAVEPAMRERFERLLETAGAL